MHSDSISTIGKNHTVCQDYSRSSDEYAIVSDGCSASPDSDFGARILVKEAENLILDGLWNPNLCINAAYRKILDLRLHDYSLDATLLLCQIKTFDNVQCAVIEKYGDGCIVIKYKDGKVLIKNTEYKSGYPHYLSYTLSEERHNLLKDTVGSSDKKTTITEVIEGKTTEFSVIEENISIYPIDNIESIFLFSDGVSSFTKKKDGIISNISYLEIVNYMANVSNYKGEFIKRQMNGLNRFCKENNYEHFDDFTVACIRL